MSFDEGREFYEFFLLDMCLQQSSKKHFHDPEKLLNVPLKSFLPVPNT